MANSFNELFGLGSHSPDASLEGWFPCQDNAASTTVVDESGNNNNATATDNTNTYATTGPNNWLTSAFASTTSDYVTLPSYTIGGNPRTMMIRGKYPSSNSQFNYLFGSKTPGVEQNLIEVFGNRPRGNKNTPAFIYGANSRYGVSNNSLSHSTWFSLASTLDASLNANGYLDGSFHASTTFSNAPDTTPILYLAGHESVSTTTGSFPGDIVDASFFSRELTSSEVAEWDSGPEPVNTVAPALSGTEQEGETLTATTGTWGIDSPFASGSNGTITYSYQWYRADDFLGTNRAAISGETATTYTLVSADVGKVVQVEVRATNDGGFDSDADTSSSYTNTIQPSLGGFNVYWANRATQIAGALQ